MQKTCTLIAATAIMASPAIAQDVTYADLSYILKNSEIDVPFGTDGEVDQRSYTLDGAIDFEIGQFVISAEVNSFTQSFVFGSLDLRSHRASAAYRITPEFLAGVGIEDSNTIDDLIVFAPTAESNLSYELFGQYSNDVFGAAINHQIYNTSDVFEDLDFSVTSVYGEATFLPGASVGVMASDNSEFDVRTYVVSLDYDNGPVDARAFVLSVDSDEIDTDERIAGLSAHYEFAGDFRALASYLTSVDFEFQEFDIFNIGLGYQVAENAWLDVGFGRDDVRTDFDDDFENDTFFVALNFETGTQARLDRKLERAFRNDIQEVYSALIFFGGPI